MMLSKRSSSIVTTNCLLLLVLLSGSATAKDGPILELAGRTIVLTLIKVDSRAPVRWPSGNSQLSTESVLIGPQTDIPGQLVSNGINPDSGAYTLVYDLNPGVSNLNALKSGTRVTLPSIKPSTGLQKQLGHGYLVALSIDPQLHETLANSIKQITTLHDRFGALPASRFATTNDQATVVKQVNDITMWFSVIRRTNQQKKGPPTSRATLNDLNAEAQALISVLKPVVDGKNTLSSADTEQIAAIHHDVGEEIKRYDEVLSGSTPGADLAPCCIIQVTILGGDEAKLKTLRVYYSLLGRFHDPPRPRNSPEPDPFPGLGSGNSDPLPPKTFKVWVAPDGKPDDFLTEGATKVTIQRSQAIEKIELNLKK
jgi:hypothetical protein